jgi:hypothetical protein
MRLIKDAITGILGVSKSGPGESDKVVDVHEEEISSDSSQGDFDYISTQLISETNLNIAEIQIEKFNKAEISKKLKDCVISSSKRSKC